MRELTDECLFPFGTHFKNRVKMKDVPVDYFDWMLAQPWADKWPAVQDYARRVKSALQKEWESKEAAADIGFNRAPLPTHKPNLDVRERVKQVSEVKLAAIKHLLKTGEEYAILPCPRCGRSIMIHVSARSYTGSEVKYTTLASCETPNCLKWT